MALDKTILGTAIANSIIDPSAPLDVKQTITDSWISIADIIINHIKTAGVVTIPLGIPVSTAGTAAAQTGATTAPATGTIF